MKLLFAFIFLLVSGLGLAQKKDVYFLKNDGRYVTNRDSADYIRIVTEPDSGSALYNVFELFPNGKRKSQGKSSTINPPVYEGQCVTFYKNGNRKSISNYRDGKLVNEGYKFYPNGKLYQEVQYPEDGELYNDFMGNYLVKANFDSLGTALVIDGNGYFKRYDDDFKHVTDSGSVKNGRMDGQWAGITSDGKWHFAEKYDNGTLLSGTLIDENGLTTTYTKNRATEPGYKGGLDAFYAYLGNNIVYPDYERANNVQGKVIMSFVVEKDGKISDIKILHSVSFNIDKEAVRVVKKSPAWIPGTVYGRPVRVVYSIPISFKLTD